MKTVTKIWLLTEIDLKIIFCLPISYSLHSVPTKKLNPFNHTQNKVGYLSCFATEVKLEQFL
jgi:hypothetical protein